MQIAPPAAPPEAVAELKRAHRGVWAAGDYAAVAAHIDVLPPRDVLARTAPGPGEAVLDVATGTGNVALLAAAAGAHVTGLDLTPELLDVARRRAAEHRVRVDWIAGDAEELPFDDGSFDCVLSVFGVQFAPRHEVAAAELVRVCRPGGRIGLVNWTPDGAIGELLAIVGRSMPRPPAFASPPPRWGDEAHVRGLFAAAGVADVAVELGVNPWRFPSADALVSFFETSYGPLLKARERLTGDGRWAACRAEIVAMLERRNVATDGSLLVDAEYLVVVARP